MNLRRTVFSIVLVFGAAAAAQSPEASGAPDPAAAEEGATDVVAPPVLPLQFAATLELPACAQRTREAGVGAVEVESMLGSMREFRVEVSEMCVLLDAAVGAVERGEKPYDFGVFLRQQLEAGLRGGELADAIRVARSHGDAPVNRRPRVQPMGSGLVDQVRPVAGSGDGEGGAQ